VELLHARYDVGVEMLGIPGTLLGVLDGRRADGLVVKGVEE
jgi:hypothetical protein